MAPLMYGSSCSKGVLEIAKPGQVLVSSTVKDPHGLLIGPLRDQETFDLTRIQRIT